MREREREKSTIVNYINYVYKRAFLFISSNLQHLKKNFRHFIDSYKNK